MSFNRLSLRSPTGIVDLTLSLTPPTTPPPLSPTTSIAGYAQPCTPDHPPPQMRVRAPRRCSICRLTGHDARRCSNDTSVHFRGQIFNMYNNPRENLTEFVYGRIVQRCPEIQDFPRLSERLFEDVCFHVLDLSHLQVREALRNPMSIINFGYAQLLHRVEDVRLTQPPYQVRLGKDFAKRIVVELQSSDEKGSECFICCDKSCTVKTSCNHDYCVDCIISIIDTNKAKTMEAACSFCKAPFTQMTVNNQPSHTTLCDFINNL
jgi:hypothetical protein